MSAVIFCPAKNAMQSGRSGGQQWWVLAYQPSVPKTADSLMGWTGSQDMKADQIRLTFKTKDEAIAYAERNGIAYNVIQNNDRKVVPKSYADNFRWRRE